MYSQHNAWLSGQGMAKLIQIIRQAPVEPGIPMPEILVVAPPPIVQPKGVIASKFEGSEKRCVGLPEELEKVAEEQGAYFLMPGT